MSVLIYVVDDEPDILHLVSLHLKKASFHVDTFQNATTFLKALEKKRPDLILLDLMLPDMDGLSVCNQLKKDESFSSIPIIMLTAKAQESDKIMGLDIGADDYITKPFSPRELVARVKAVLRRTGKDQKKTISMGKNLSIDLERYEIKVKNNLITLTAVEFKILSLLASNPGKVFSREKILDHLWGTEKAVIDRTVDVHIKHLREKLGNAGDLIKNVRGIGYKIEE